MPNQVQPQISSSLAVSLFLTISFQSSYFSFQFKFYFYNPISQQLPQRALERQKAVNRQTDNTPCPYTLRQGQRKNSKNPAMGKSETSGRTTDGGSTPRRGQAMQWMWTVTNRLQGVLELSTWKFWGPCKYNLQRATVLGKLLYAEDGNLT